MKTKNKFRTYIEIFLKGKNLPAMYLENLKMAALVEKDFKLASSIREFQIKYSK